MFEIVSLFGLLVSALLIVNTSSENKINIYLSLFFLTISLFSLTRNFVLYANHPWVLYLFIPGAIPFFNMSAPLLYLYIRKSMQPGESTDLSWKDSLHFLPALIMLINVVPHLMLPYSERMLFSEQLTLNQFKIIEIKTLFIPINFNLLLRPFIGVVYCLAALKIYVANKELADVNEKSNTQASTMWFLILIISAGSSYITSFFIGLYMNVLNYDASNLPIMKKLMLFPTMILFVMNGSIFFFPRVIYGIIKRKTVKKEFLPEKLVFNDYVNSPLRNLLPDSVNAENNNVAISRKLAEYFGSKPFLQPGFTLSIITQETNIPYHQLTTYYNNYLGINFNDWKNNARIDHALDLIKNGRAKNLTLESIAYSCGFLSRSNFVNSFRKKTGLTPSEFLKSIPQESIVVSMDF
jgi:AraC-like DNA-binding protein